MNDSDQLKEILSKVDTTKMMASISSRLDRVARVFLVDKPAELARAQLVTFLLQYVQSAPIHLTQLSYLAKEFKLADCLKPSIRVGSEHLADAAKLRPSQSDDALGEVESILSLLQAAYTLHRLIEDIDDKIEMFIGIPLTAIDAIYANVIVHEIIGDRFANQLDQMVTKLVNSSELRKAILEAHFDREQVVQFKAERKSLSGDEIEDFAGKFGISMI